MFVYFSDGIKCNFSIDLNRFPEKKIEMKVKAQEKMENSAFILHP